MKLEEYLKRIELLILKGQKLLQTRRSFQYVTGEAVDNIGFTDFRTSSLSFIKQTFGSSSPHYIEFESKVEYAEPHCVEFGIGVLSAVKEDLEGGWLVSTKELLSAEIFSDFFEMAKYLLDEDYKDPAAVIIGSVLEGRLRQLAEKNGIEITYDKAGKKVPKKADQLNIELAKANIYNLLDQKSITSHLDLRNKAAHGLYDNYTKSQVELMHQSVLDFMTRVSL